MNASHQNITQNSSYNKSRCNSAATSAIRIMLLTVFACFVRFLCHYPSWLPSGRGRMINLCPHLWFSKQREGLHNCRTPKSRRILVVALPYIVFNRRVDQLSFASGGAPGRHMGPEKGYFTAQREVKWLRRSEQWRRLSGEITVAAIYGTLPA